MLYLDGIAVSEYYLSVKERSEIPTAERDVEIIEIRGRHGSLTKKFGYKNKPLKVKFNFLEDVPFKSVFRVFKNVLLNAKILKFSDDPDIYNKIKNVTIETATNEVEEYGEFIVDFLLDPFDYEEDVTINISGATTIFNQGYEAEPYIKIYGAGTGKVYINGQSFQVTIDDFVEVDCDMMNAYKTVNGIISSRNGKMVGVFPILSSGENNISFDGGITKLELIPRWRWL